MKRSRKLELFYAIAMLICFTQWVACNNNGDSGDYKRTPKDSVRTWVLFTNPPQWGLGTGINIDFIDRITKDTAYFDTLDENTAKKTYKRDTAYWVTYIQYEVDSVTQKAKLDSLKRPIIKNKYYLELPKSNIKKDLNNYTP